MKKLKHGNVTVEVEENPALKYPESLLYKGPCIRIFSITDDDGNARTFYGVEQTDRSNVGFHIGRTYEGTLVEKDSKVYLDQGYRQLLMGELVA